jgi:hypothetical protein
MARPLRIEYEGAVYHVTARGSERGKIFFSKRDYEKFKEYLAEAQEKHGFILHSYVLRKIEGSGLERGQNYAKLYVKPAEEVRDGKTFTDRI